MKIYLHVHFQMYDGKTILSRHFAGDWLINHQTGQRLTLELVDLPFPSRSYWLRVNGKWAKKLPVASKTAVIRQLRQWWVAH